MSTQCPASRVTCPGAGGVAAEWGRGLHRAEGRGGGGAAARPHPGRHRDQGPAQLQVTPGTHTGLQTAPDQILL